MARIKCKLMWDEDEDEKRLTSTTGTLIRQMRIKTGKQGHGVDVYCIKNWTTFCLIRTWKEFHQGQEWGLAKPPNITKTGWGLKRREKYFLMELAASALTHQNCTLSRWSWERIHEKDKKMEMNWPNETKKNGNEMKLYSNKFLELTICTDFARLSWEWRYWHLGKKYQLWRSKAPQPKKLQSPNWSHFRELF